IGRTLLVKVKSNQQVRAQPHAFPSHKHQDKIIRQHQRQHRKHEQIQVGKKTVVPPFMRHVSRRVYVNQKPYPRYHQYHHGDELVEHKSEISHKAFGLYPTKIIETQSSNLLWGCLKQSDEHHQGQEERRARRPTGDNTDDTVRKSLSEKTVKESSHQRKKRDSEK